jgi:hypothetical protein
VRRRDVIIISAAVGVLIILGILGSIYYDLVTEGGEPYTRNEQKAEYTRMQRVVDFESISAWAMECMGVTSYENLPTQYQVLLSYYRPTPNNASALPDEARKLTIYNEQRAILVLNRSLSFGRISYQLQAEDANSWFKFLTLLGIGVGMLTTVVVSISSTEFGRGEGDREKAIRLLAIILPILGTVMPGVIAFYSPQTYVNQASRALTRVTQLHAQMAVNIWTLKCDLDDDAKKRLNEWSARYVDIQTISAAGGVPLPTTSIADAPVP